MGVPGETPRLESIERQFIDDVGEVAGKDVNRSEAMVTEWDLLASIRPGRLEQVEQESRDEDVHCGGDCQPERENPLENYQTRCGRMDEYHTKACILNRSKLL